jgi:hypothetical protein
MNKHNSFKNYIFVDECTVRILDVPLYHCRRKGEQVSVPATSRIRLKVNIWGAISTKGACPVVVRSLLLNNNYLVINCCLNLDI